VIISDGVGSSWKRGRELLSQWSGVGQSGRTGGRVPLLGYSTAHNKNESLKLKKKIYIYV
jgi:hypothetical protein